MIRDFLAHISKNDPSTVLVFKTATSDAHSADIQTLMSYVFDVLDQSEKFYLKEPIFTYCVLHPSQDILTNFPPPPRDTQLLLPPQKEIIIRFFAYLEELLWNRAPEAFDIVSSAGSESYQIMYRAYLFAPPLISLSQSGRTTMREHVLRIVAPSHADVRQKLQEFLRWLVHSSTLRLLPTQIARQKKFEDLEREKITLQKIIEERIMAIQDANNAYRRILQMVREKLAAGTQPRRNMEMRFIGIHMKLHNIGNELDAEWRKVDALTSNLDHLSTLQEEIAQLQGELSVIEKELMSLLSRS